MSTAGGQGPDLSRIVSLIMQNPDLIRQIETLAKQNTENENEAPDTAPTISAATETADAPTTVPTVAEPHNADKRKKRTQLLSALRPYVSEKRGKTIDTLLGAMDLWDLVGRG